jgi:hypothetical protein
MQIIVRPVVLSLPHHLKSLFLLQTIFSVVKKAIDFS